MLIFNSKHIKAGCTILSSDISELLCCDMVQCRKKDLHKIQIGQNRVAYLVLNCIHRAGRGNACWSVHVDDGGEAGVQSVNFLLGNIFSKADIMLLGIDAITKLDK